MDMVNIEMLAADCNALDKNTHSIDCSAWFESMGKRAAALLKNFSELRKFMTNNPKLFCDGGTLGEYNSVRAYTEEARIEMNKMGWTFKNSNGTYEWYQFSTDLSYVASNNHSALIPPERMRFVADKVDLLERLWTDDIPKTVGEYLRTLRDKAYALNNDVRKMAMVNGKNDRVKRIIISVEM